MELCCSAKPDLQHLADQPGFTHPFLDFIAPFEQEFKGSPRPQQSGGLHGLPNELLLQIFEPLQNELYTLSLVSRRLHHLALPIFLARNGMSPFAGELILFDDRSQEVLQALSIALFRPALKRIHCTFNFCWPEKKLVRNMCGVVRLASKLSRMEEVHFDLIHVSNVGSETDSNWYKEYLAGNVTSDWEQEFLFLFHSILETGCTTLTVCLQGTKWSPASTPDPLTSAISSRKWSSKLSDFLPHFSITNFISALKWLTSQENGLSLAPSVVMPSHKDLTNFNLHCSMLLHAPFCSWTIETLNSSNLTTLSLKNLYVHSKVWTNILPSLTLHMLSFLSIDACTIGYRDLSDFLHRHPHIIRLYLGRRLVPPPPDVRSAKPPLHQLVHLSATQEYLINFLSATSSSPDLRTVILMVRILRGDRFNFERLNNAMSPISHRFRKAELILELALESSTGDWMLQEVHPKIHGRESVVSQVAEIRINLLTYNLHRDVMAILPRWLSCFPGLKHVSIATPSQAPSYNALLMHPFFQSMSNLCPGVETVGINDLVYDIDACL